MLRGDRQDGGEIDAAVRIARHREDPAPHALEKAQPLSLDLAHDRGAHVLRVDVAHAGHVLSRERGRVGAREEGVAGVEEELRRGAGLAHQSVDLGLALHDRAHVVVVDEVDPGMRAMGRERLDARREARPLGLRQHRALGERHALVAMHRVRGLAHHDHPRAHGVEEVEHGVDGCDLLVEAAGEKVQRVPAGNVGEAVRRERRPQRRRLLRELVALLDAVEADAGGVREAALERDVGAEAAVVVVRPGDGVGAEADHGGPRQRRCAARASS